MALWPRPFAGAQQVPMRSDAGSGSHTFSRLVAWSDKAVHRTVSGLRISVAAVRKPPASVGRVHATHADGLVSRSTGKLMRRSAPPSCPRDNPSRCGKAVHATSPEPLPSVWLPGEPPTRRPRRRTTPAWSGRRSSRAATTASRRREAPDAGTTPSNGAIRVESRSS